MVVKIYYACLLMVIMQVAFLRLADSPVWANTDSPNRSGAVLGVHILHPEELSAAKTLVQTTNQEQWQYLTIPITLADLDKKETWRRFFEQAGEQRMIPLVRLATRSENGMWVAPVREDIIRLLDFLNELPWPTSQRHIIVFNEVNHAKEWGGSINPAQYGAVLRFSSQYARSLSSDFVILPAAMDLAAPNSGATREALSYWREVTATDPDVLSMLDYWNSHSYPNPAFSSSPERTTQNSLRGYQHELAFVKDHTNKDFQVFITETGWVETTATRPWLESYYLYAMQHVWSDPRIVAVTPFLLRGDPGPFSRFSFLDRNNQPTSQYLALRKVLEQLNY